MEKIIVIGRTDLWSNVVLPNLCGAISCIMQSLKSLFLPMSNWVSFSEGTRSKFSVSCPADHFCLSTNVSDLNPTDHFQQPKKALWTWLKEVHGDRKATYKNLGTWAGGVMLLYCVCTGEKTHIFRFWHFLLNKNFVIFSWKLKGRV